MDFGGPQIPQAGGAADAALQQRIQALEAEKSQAEAATKATEEKIKTMTTVTDAALTEDAAHVPGSTRHAGAADGLGGPRDRASRGYGPRDADEIRRRRRLKTAQRHARNRR